MSRQHYNRRSPKLTFHETTLFFSKNFKQKGKKWRNRNSKISRDPIRETRIKHGIPSRTMSQIVLLDLD